ATCWSSPKSQSAQPTPVAPAHAEQHTPRTTVSPRYARSRLSVFNHPRSWPVVRGEAGAALPFLLLDVMLVSAVRATMTHLRIGATLSVSVMSDANRRCQYGEMGRTY